jgi:hypothetical protein
MRNALIRPPARDSIPLPCLRSREVPASPGSGPPRGLDPSFEPLQWATEGPLAPAMGHRGGSPRLARPGDGPSAGFGPGVGGEPRFAPSRAAPTDFAKALDSLVTLP